MRSLTLIIAFLALSTLTYAQKPIITFDKTTHDFGKIKEEGGQTTFVFTFTNTGNAPMVINRVQASCGCTVPAWTREPIEAGKKGNISVSYNPMGRPGTFSKNITVFSNASESAVNLLIVGDVIPRETSDIGGSTSGLPVAVGNLRMSTRMVQMNNIDKGNIQTRTIEIQNTGTSDLRAVIENLPQHLTATVVPTTLKPRETGRINLSFDTNKMNAWGPISNNVYVVLNGEKRYTDTFKISIDANIIENFSKLTPDQKRKAPIVELNSRTINFGEVKPRSKKVAILKISNKGINNLEIRRITNNNKEINIKKTARSIGSGKSTNVYFDLNTANLPEGDYKKAVTIQTNDPDNSIVIVTLNWKVKK